MLNPDQDFRFSTAHFFTPEYEAKIQSYGFETVEVDQLEPGYIIVTRHNISDDRPLGRGGHLSIYLESVKEGYLTVSFNRDLANAWDGLGTQIVPYEFNPKTQRRRFFKFRVKAMLGFFKQYYGKFRIGVDQLIASCKKIDITSEEILATLKTEMPLVLAWTKAIRASEIFETLGSLIPFYWALKTHKIMEYLYIAQEMLKANFFEHLKKDDQSHSYLISKLQTADIEDINGYSIPAPDSRPEAFPKLGGETFMGSPGPAILALIHYLFADKQEPSAFLWRIQLPQALLEDKNLKTALTPSKFFDVKSNTLVLPHSGYLFGGSAEKGVDVVAAEKKSETGTSPQDCTSFLTLLPS